MKKLIEKAFPYVAVLSMFCVIAYAAFRTEITEHLNAIKSNDTIETVSAVVDKIIQFPQEWSAYAINLKNDNTDTDISEVDTTTTNEDEPTVEPTTVEEDEWEFTPLEYLPTLDGYEVYLDPDLQQHMYDLSCEYGVPYELTLAVCHIESCFQPDVNNAGLNNDGTTDWGLMGLNDKYIQYNCDLYNDGVRIDMLDPYENSYIGIRILGAFYAKYGNAYDVACSYNLGESGWARKKASEGSWYYGDKVVAYMDLIESYIY